MHMRMVESQVVPEGGKEAVSSLEVAAPWLSSAFTLWGFPGGSAGKESTCSVGGLGSNPGLGRSPGEGNGHTLWYFSLENSGSQRLGHDWATFTFTLCY